MAKQKGLKMLRVLFGAATLTGFWIAVVVLVALLAGCTSVAGNPACLVQCHVTGVQ